MSSAQSVHSFEIRKLAKKYRSRFVVRDLSLQVKSGEIVGLLGPNGAGKTTSFDLAVGLVSSRQGTILLDGQDITRLPLYARARLGIAYLPQEASIFRKLTVAENLLAILELRSLNRKQRYTKLEQLLETLNIAHVRHVRGLSLSGGERRRVEIGRLLCLEPWFVLLDEPFAGIDPLAIGGLEKIIRYLAACGIGVLITDHNVRKTLAICDRAYVMHQGQVIAEGDSDAILNNAQVKQVYLGENFLL